MSGESRVNPQIRKVEIGIKQLREISIFPLSVRDQKHLSSIIAEALQSFVNREGKSDIEFIKDIIVLIEDNLELILGLVTEVDKGEDMLSTMTNNQMLEIAEIIYKENYESLIKKVVSLMGGMGQLLNLNKQSPLSSEDTPNTDSTISMEDPGEMGD